MKSKKKIYYLPTYGQLGNWLSVLAHLTAFAIEYDYEIIFFKSKMLTQTLKAEESKNKQLRFSKLLANSFTSLLFNNLVKFIASSSNKQFAKYLVLNQPFQVDDYIIKNKFPQNLVITNWLFRFNSGVIRHQDEVRKRLAFDESTFQNAKALLKNIELNYQSHTVVGIHVRRGDYATWLNGKYYYSDETYYEKMKKMNNQLKETVFIICSNDIFTFENKENLNILYAKGSPSEDIFLLSKCNYIIGPPSTFSSFAAFMGDQYLLILENSYDDVCLKNFKKFYLQ